MKPWEAYQTPTSGPWVAFQAQPEVYSPTEGMSALERAKAGAGKAFVDIGRGAQQAAKEYLSQQPGAEWNGAGWLASRIDSPDIAEARRIDKPLMSTTAGMVGNVGGNIAAVLPSMFVPGANTLVGAGVVGAAQGMLQPTIEGESRATNTLLGGTLGAGSQYVTGRTAQAVADRFGRKVIQGAQGQPANAVRDAVLTDSQAAGYVIPPSMANGPMPLRLMEGISGKYKTNQMASIRNQDVTNRLAKQAIGVPDDVPLTPEVLQQVRQGAGNAYAAVEQLPAINWDKAFLSNIKGMRRLGGATTNPADQAIDGLVGQLANKNQWTGREVVADIKNLREMAKANFAAVQRGGGDVGAQTLAKAQQRAADALEDLVERNLSLNSAPVSLIQDLRASRQLIAKTYNIERALDPATGNIAAREFGKAVQKGKPVSGELEVVGRFANAYKDVARVPESGWANPLTAVDFGFGALGAGVSPAAMALPAARVGSRYAILSGPAQRMLGSSPQGPGLFDMAAYTMLNNPVAQRAGLFAPALAYAGQE